MKCSPTTAACSKIARGARHCLQAGLHQTGKLVGSSPFQGARRPTAAPGSALHPRRSSRAPANESPVSTKPDQLHRPRRPSNASPMWRKSGTGSSSGSAPTTAPKLDRIRRRQRGELQPLRNRGAGAKVGVGVAELRPAAPDQHRRSCSPSRQVVQGSWSQRRRAPSHRTKEQRRAPGVGSEEALLSPRHSRGVVRQAAAPCSDDTGCREGQIKRSAEKMGDLGRAVPRAGASSGVRNCLSRALCADSPG